MVVEPFRHQSGQPDGQPAKEAGIATRDIIPLNVMAGGRSLLNEDVQPRSPVQGKTVAVELRRKTTGWKVSLEPVRESG